MTDQRLSEAVKVKAAMEDLLRREGWEMLRDLLEKQIFNLRQELELKPIKKIDEVFEKEYIKGEIARMRLLIELPQIRIREAEMLIEQARKREGEDDVGSE